ncbi:DUF4376 domain-containing protein [Candidatus Avoscillospira sp. LCP25S3_F1]|uniref:DUF4376 domain-containing protein n=1 Tax=Candidatus Avoscillospira sp. LCP25S3_F1 TaxID=3438825 RepID=UPI003F8DAF60
MKVTYTNQSYDCTKAVQEGEKATLYLTDGSVVEFVGVAESAWEKFQFDGGSWYQPPLEEGKAQRIAQSKTDLAAYLESHPIQWNDGERYSITAEKQQQLTGKILSATLAQQTSTPYSLTWNSTGQVCKEWTLEELGKLAFAIDARVTALVTYQQTQEVAMRDAESLEALAAIEVDYDAVE